jgi:hypothetical protein
MRTGETMGMERATGRMAMGNRIEVGESIEKDVCNRPNMTAAFQV